MVKGHAPIRQKALQIAETARREGVRRNEYHHFSAARQVGVQLFDLRDAGHAVPGGKILHGIVGDQQVAVRRDVEGQRVQIVDHIACIGSREHERVVAHGFTVVHGEVADRRIGGQNRLHGDRQPFLAVVGDRCLGIADRELEKVLQRADTGAISLCHHDRRGCLDAVSPRHGGVLPDVEVLNAHLAGVALGKLGRCREHVCLRAGAADVLLLVAEDDAQRLLRAHAVHDIPVQVVIARVGHGEGQLRGHADIPAVAERQLGDDAVQKDHRHHGQHREKHRDRSEAARLPGIFFCHVRFSSPRLSSSAACRTPARSGTGIRTTATHSRG